jgi:hypothetical protein
VADTMKFLKPRQGLIVRDPSTLIPLPAEGASVTWIGSAGTYWRRRVRCSDVKEVKPITKKRRE